ncbi:MAG: hypothetical protein ABWY16_08640 [Pedobacter sp.]|uniref:hypothetical protein n=1 Tax=Pedobacter sp. TaxID=1411316 RepID=UPI003393EAC5
MNYCLDCGGKLSGRLDKKFCDDYCRGHYNNQLNKNKNTTLKEINNILKKNAAILKKLEERGITRSSQQILTVAGFNFNFYTHQVYGQMGELYHCCYNYGYCFMAEGEIVLRVIQDRDKI